MAPKIAVILEGQIPPVNMLDTMISEWHPRSGKIVVTPWSPAGSLDIPALGDDRLCTNTILRRS